MTTTSDGKGCPEDARVCPDGTLIVRELPDCEFPDCGPVDSFGYTTYNISFIIYIFISFFIVLF